MITEVLSYKSNIKILKLFSLAPGKSLNRTAIQQFTRISNLPLDLALSRLVKKGIITKERRSYRLNLSKRDVTSILNMLKDEQAIIRELPYTIWLVLFDFSIDISEKTGFSRIILFGSHAKHISREDSDIDIALVSEKKDTKQELAAEEIAKKITEKYGKKIQIHYFESQEFSQAGSGPGLINEIKKDGIEIS